MEEKSQAYQILAFIKENYGKHELDILVEFIEKEFPEDFNKYESDHYDGPGDSYYQ